jgi:dTDP-glucose pyrophosphorylase/CBS domain-containing protein
VSNPVKYFISAKANIREAIDSIDQGAAQIALVVDAEQKLIGTVTDGDIRRGLLKRETLDSPVERVMHREFRFVREGVEEQAVLDLMSREVLHQIPMLDSQGRAVRLFLLEELLQQKTLPNAVVIMAGGEGKRLRPLTKNCPKPMLPVQGKPMLEILLERCKTAGFGQFYFAVNYLKQQIIDHFGDGSRWGVDIHYLEETHPLGTAGALSLLPEIPEDPVLVLNGDVLTQVPFPALLRFHQEHQAVATVCVREHETVIPYGVVRTEGTRMVALEEKPTLTNYVNAGVYVLSPQVWTYLNREEACDMPELLESLQQSNQPIHVFPIHEYWLDVGHLETLERAHQEWS